MRKSLFPVAMLFGVAVATSCGVQVDSKNESSFAASTSTPEPRHLLVDDPLANASLSQVAKASDLVITGTVQSTKDGVQIGEDFSLTYSVLSVRVGRAIKGESPDFVEVILSTGSDGQPVELYGRSTPTHDESLWLLKRLDPEFGLDGYTLTSVAGLVAAVDGKVVAPSAGGSDYPAVGEALRAGTIDRIVSQLQQ